MSVRSRFLSFFVLVVVFRRGRSKPFRESGPEMSFAHDVWLRLRLSFCIISGGSGSFVLIWEQRPFSELRRLALISERHQFGKPGSFVSIPG